MFEDLYDTVSLMLSWRWPTVEGKITAVDIERISQSGKGESWRLAVTYQFSLADDGPYTGESFWNPYYSSRARVRTARGKILIHRSVRVRYRPDDPSVNKLDRNVWKDLLDQVVPDL
jgi:hypothetical protein